MRICFIGHAASIHTRLWAEGMAKRGHDIHLVTTMPDEVRGVAQYPIKTHLKSSLGYFTAIPAVNAAIKRIKPEIVHAEYVISNGLMAAFPGFHPLALSCMGNDVLVDPYQSRLKRMVVKATLSRADAVVSIGRHMADNLRELGVPQKKLSIIVRGVYSDDFPFVDRTPQLQAPSFLYSRGYMDYSNYSLLLRAIPIIREKLPRARFIMVGGGPEQDRARELARKLGIGDELVMKSLIPHQELRRYAAEAAFHVSTTTTDGTAISLFEAMAAGMFPLVSDITANRDWIVSGENGFLVPLDDPNALADAAVRAASEPELFRRVAAANRATAQEKGDYNKTLLAFEELFKSLIAKNRES